MKNIPFYLLGIASIFVIVLVLSFSVEEKNKYELNETEEELLEKIVNKEQFVSPQWLAGQLLKTEEAFILVDIRNPFNYMAGHIDGAVNIPFQQILDESWEAFFEDSSQLKVLYCNLDIYANEAWMLLDQLGYKNIKVLAGGLNFWNDHTVTSYNMKSEGAYDETPAYDYKIEMKKAGDGSAVPATPQGGAPVQFKVKKKGGPKGGCG